MRIKLTKGLIACAYASVVAACASESVGPPPAPPVNWQSLQTPPSVDAGHDQLTSLERQVAEAYVEALESPDFAALSPKFDDDARFTFPGSPDARGRSAVVMAHQTLLGAFSERKVLAHRIFRTSGQQTVEWTMTGVQTGAWMGVMPTQKPVAVEGLSLLFTKDDGSISEAHVYFDVAAVKAELGAGPKGLTAVFPTPPMTAGGHGAPEVLEQAGTPDEKQNVAAVHEALDALEGGKRVAYLAAFADDAEVLTSERKEPWRGKADIGAYFDTARRAIGNLDTTVTDGWGVQQFAVVEYTIAGEQRGAVGWVPVEPDRAIRFHIVDVVKIQAGKLGVVRRYENPAEVVSSPLR